MENQERVNPTNSPTPNPAFLFAEWSSKDKCFTYYDKVNKVKDVKLPFPLTFVPLYKCICLKGYNHKKGENHQSNEIPDRTLETNPFVVRTYNHNTKKGEIRIKGYYAQLGDLMELNKIKYTVSLYAGLKNKKGEMMLVNFQLNGGALTHWFGFENGNNIYKGQVKVDEFTNEVNGDVEYTAPKYKPEPISPEDNAKALILQKEITAYLNSYFAQNANILNTATADKQNRQPEISPQTEVDNGDKNPVTPPVITTNYNDDLDNLPF